MRARQRHLVLGQTGATVVLDSRMLTESDGTGLDSWTNRGSLAISPSATGTERPTVERSEQGGNPVVRFDGSNDRLTFNSSTASFNYLFNDVSTVIATWRHGTVSDPNTVHILFDNCEFAAQRGSTLAYDDRASISRNNTACPRAIAAGGTAIFNPTIQNFSTPNEFCIWAMIGDPANATASERVSMSRNAGAQQKTNAATNAIGSGNAGSNMTIGRQAQGGGPLNGDIAQICIWSEKFSEAKSKRFERAAAFSFKISCN